MPSSTRCSSGWRDGALCGAELAALQATDSDVFVYSGGSTDLTTGSPARSPA